jgi:hypothetical protein
MDFTAGCRIGFFFIDDHGIQLAQQEICKFQLKSLPQS